MFNEKDCWTIPTVRVYRLTTCRFEVLQELAHKKGHVLEAGQTYAVREVRRTGDKAASIIVRDPSRITLLPLWRDEGPSLTQLPHRSASFYVFPTAVSAGRRFATVPWAARSSAMGRIWLCGSNGRRGQRLLAFLGPMRTEGPNHDNPTVEPAHTPSGCINELGTFPFA